MPGAAATLLGGCEIGLRRLPRIRLLAEEEAGAVEVDVGHVQPHRPALGDLPRFVEVGLCAVGASVRAGEKAQPGAGEETERKILLQTGAAKTVYGRVNGSVH